MRPFARTLVFACLVLAPATALAQAVIAGTVKDASGAILPGVSVEATSPALIEKVRTAVTDGTGQYRIEDLRPGTYTVTFTLQGFSTFKREGIELSGSFTATGGETPIVDVQSAKREMTLVSPWVNNARASWNAFYAQEQWTHKRLTLQGALRYDHASSSFPAQTLGPSRFLPTPISFPETPGVDSYNDISPRVGVAYDVFGNGRTALKANVGKYLEGVGTAGNYVVSNPTSRMPITVGGAFSTGGVTRAWTDVNHNFQPDCDLLNPGAQNLSATGGDVCGPISNQKFGQNVFTNSVDPALLKGWGVRPSDWSTNISIQQQILSRASVEIAYSRRTFRGFAVTDNTLVGAGDYSQYSITAPQDSRLPNGGGYTISGIYDVTPCSSVRSII